MQITENTIEQRGDNISHQGIVLDQSLVPVSITHGTNDSDGVMMAGPEEGPNERRKSTAQALLKNPTHLISSKNSVDDYNS